MYAAPGRIALNRRRGGGDLAQLRLESGYHQPRRGAPDRCCRVIIARVAARLAAARLELLAMLLLFRLLTVILFIFEGPIFAGADSVDSHSAETHIFDGITVDACVDAVNTFAVLFTQVIYKRDTKRGCRIEM